MIKIFAVDDNQGIIDMLKEYFDGNKKIEIVDEAHDGEEALNKIIKNKDAYDIIILDLIMPKKDGVYVLTELKKRKIYKNIIVLTSFNEQETIRNVSNLGARYFVLKPFDLKDLEYKIIETVEHFENNGGIIDLYENNMSLNITKILHELGIPSHIKGYLYIKEAIILVYNNPKLIGGITKELYPEIGRKFKTSVSRVERAIRHAIEVSWNRGDWKLMEDIFGHSVDIDKAKPTNSEFIVTIADKLRLDTIKVN